MSLLENMAANVENDERILASIVRMPDRFIDLRRGIVAPSRALPSAERERKTRQAQALRATGETYQAIGEKLGISKVTASKYANVTPLNTDKRTGAKIDYPYQVDQGGNSERPFPPTVGRRTH